MKITRIWILQFNSTYLSQFLSIIVSKHFTTQTTAHKLPDNDGFESNKPVFPGTIKHKCSYCIAFPNWNRHAHTSVLFTHGVMLSVGTVHMANSIVLAGATLLS